MIHYFYENIPEFPIPPHYTEGLEKLINKEGKELSTIQYIFCDDEYLLAINKQYLNHDYYTDIITFDYVSGDLISGDIFISLPRIKENSKLYTTEVDKELLRVLIHGLLHLCGYKDKTEEESKLMREKEDFYIQSINYL